MKASHKQLFAPQKIYRPEGCGGGEANKIPNRPNAQTFGLGLEEATCNKGCSISGIAFDWTRAHPADGTIGTVADREASGFWDVPCGRAGMGRVECVRPCDRHATKVYEVQ